MALDTEAVIRKLEARLQREKALADDELEIELLTYVIDRLTESSVNEYITEQRRKQQEFLATHDRPDEGLTLVEEFDLVNQAITDVGRLLHENEQRALYDDYPANVLNPVLGILSRKSDDLHNDLREASMFDSLDEVPDVKPADEGDGQ